MFKKVKKKIEYLLKCYSIFASERKKKIECILINQVDGYVGPKNSNKASFMKEIIYFYLRQ